MSGGERVVGWWSGKETVSGTEWWRNEWTCMKPKKKMTLPCSIFGHHNHPEEIMVLCVQSGCK